MIELKPREQGRPRHRDYWKIIMLREYGWSYKKIAVLIGKPIPRQTIATICQKHFKKGRYENCKTLLKP